MDLVDVLVLKRYFFLIFSIRSYLHNSILCIFMNFPLIVIYILVELASTTVH